MEHPSYPDDLFVSSGEAKEMIDENAMVIVVDTNRPGMTECPELLTMTKTIVVFDHHRQGSDNIENALLSYIEPYASSACEMVSEVLQYIVDDVRIPAIEANSLYAGIVIDTNNFMNKTGVRTFEAAAFLRRCGADIPFVRKMLRDDMRSYQAKAGIISSAEVYRERFAIARGENLAYREPDDHRCPGSQRASRYRRDQSHLCPYVLQRKDLCERPLHRRGERPDHHGEAGRRRTYERLRRAV